MKRSKVLLLVFVLGLNAFSIYQIYHYEIRSEAQEVSTRQYNLFLAAQNSLRQISKIIFDLEINQEKFSKLLYQAIQDPQKIKIYHDLLYKEVLPLYRYLKTLSIRQLHFHLPKAISFLRIHRPNIFGDSLEGVRKSIEIAQMRQSAVFGFEEGRIFNGFRNIYPLFYKDIFVGTVEISFSAKAIDHFLSLLPYKPYFTGLLIDKRVLEKKVFPSEQKNYTNSIFPNFYWDRTILDRAKLIKAEKLLHIIETPPTTLQTFFTKNYAITFIPLKNFEDKNMAYFISIYENRFLSTLQKKLLLLFIVSSLVLLLLLLIILKYQDKKRMYEEYLRKMSFLDPLTKLYNRRGLYKNLRLLIANLQQTKGSYCILFIDIDHFKKINDTYGHEIGDKVLQTLAQILKESFRQEDIIARWGGEEFIIILPNSNIQESIIAAKKLLQKVRSFAKEGLPPFTISIGVACDETAREFEKTLKKADHYLYEAKKRGRDRIQSPLLGIEGD